MTAVKKTCGTCKKWGQIRDHPTKTLGYCHDPEQVSYSTHGVVAKMRSEHCGNWEAKEGEE